jgi:hypothetical protein
MAWDGHHRNTRPRTERPAFRRRTSVLPAVMLLSASITVTLLASACGSSSGGGTSTSPQASSSASATSSPQNSTSANTAWKAQSSGLDNSTAELTGVAFASPARGWAVGGDSANGGVILATTNGGATWKAQRPHTQATLYGVATSTPIDHWLPGLCPPEAPLEGAV